MDVPLQTGEPEPEFIQIDLSDFRQMAALALSQQRQMAIEIAHAPATANKALLSILKSQSTVLMMLAALLLERADEKDVRIVQPGGFRS